MRPHAPGHQEAGNPVPELTETLPRWGLSAVKSSGPRGKGEGGCRARDGARRWGGGIPWSGEGEGVGQGVKGQLGWPACDRDD